MASVAVIGAGDLGGALAHKLAGLDCLDRIQLIDPHGDVAAGKALDIQQAGAIEGFRTILAGTRDLAAVAGATIVVLADGAGASPAEGQANDGLPLLAQIATLDRRACIVCAAATQRLLVARGVAELKIARERLIGSAPGALVAAVRSLVALEARGAASQVALTVAGVPPAHAVVAWSGATFCGQPIEAMLPPPALARLAARVPHLWPPGPYALASAAARVCESIVRGDSRRSHCCFVVLEAEFGARGGAVAMPVLLGPGGLDRVLPLALSAHEQVQFHNGFICV